MPHRVEVEKNNYERATIHGINTVRARVWTTSEYNKQKLQSYVVSIRMMIIITKDGVAPV